MIKSNTSPTRPATFRTTLIALGCALGLALVQIPALAATEAAAPQPQAVTAPSLPLTGTFEKVATGDTGPYILKLKNDSTAALTVSGKVLLSVAFHSDTKARILPEHTIESGQVWTITGLAAADKVIITAKDFAALELVVH